MSCLHLTRLSSVVVRSSWLVSAPNRSVSWPRIWGSARSCLRNWLAQAHADENGGESRLTTAEKRELAQLRREKRRLEMENEILKRAAAFFARENILPN